MQYVLLGDIKGSRTLNPTKLWTILNQLCQRVNQKFDLAVPMIITLGDEWQMVCKTRTQCQEVLVYAQAQLGEIKFRAVIGPYRQPTHQIDSVKKFNTYLSQHSANPLISPEFTQAHEQLDQKNDGIVVLS
jgi:hypothetical protein